MDKLLCIYHAHCIDGFTAAWAVRRRLGDDVEFLAAQYGDSPPDVSGRDVAIVDFSYPLHVLMEMQDRARSVVVLDHHKSAREDLAGLPQPPSAWEIWMHASQVEAPFSQRLRLAAWFDMERSGAGLAWDFFHRAKERPWIVAHVEDRDLWRFALPRTREVHAVLSSHPYEFDVWDAISSRQSASVATEGAAILRKHNLDVDALVAMTRRRMRIGEHVVPVANVPPVFASDAGNRMAQGEPFAALYVDTPQGRLFSLRSAKDGVDVSAVAKRYGGGGHAGAAGFKAERGWEGESDA